MPKLDLTFDAGAPLDASKLMQLVEFLNELDSKALKLTSDVATLGNQNIALRMISNTYSIGKVTLSGTSKSYDVNFPDGKTLITAPSAVLITIETTTANSDIVSYISNPTQSGFKVWLNRVAGVVGKTTTASSATFDNVKVHYLALAKLDI